MLYIAYTYKKEDCDCKYCLYYSHGKYKLPWCCCYEDKVRTGSPFTKDKVVRKQLEVDFICNMGSKRYYIQSAYSIPDAEKKEQEVRPFKKIEDSFKKIIVTKDIVPATYDENGVLTVNIYDFLLNETILEQ